ncbi:MAG: pilin [Candidatus Gribaldobacteria bacterium]|nr:pilin [Candidatus Gribaldobacteria bacterium]
MKSKLLVLIFVLGLTLGFLPNLAFGKDLKQGAECCDNYDNPQNYDQCGANLKCEGDAHQPDIPIIGAKTGCYPLGSDEYKKGTCVASGPVIPAGGGAGGAGGGTPPPAPKTTGCTSVGFKCAPDGVNQDCCSNVCNEGYCADADNLEQYCQQYCCNCGTDGKLMAGKTEPTKGCILGKEKCLCSAFEIKQCDGEDGILNLINNVIDWLFWIVLIGSTLMIVVGALFMMLSAMSPDLVKKGRSIIVWSLIGLAIVASARLLAAVIRLILGGAS